jgi:excisionase family DNA binding protein
MARPVLERLRAALSAMPPGALVPRDWLVEQLAGGSAGQSDCEAPATQGVTDLTIAGLAQLFGKRPSTVRAWVERGDFPGAYKLNGREWRIPNSAVDAFKDRQRGGAASGANLSAWRSVDRKGVGRE